MGNANILQDIKGLVKIFPQSVLIGLFAILAVFLIYKYKNLLGFGFKSTLFIWVFIRKNLLIKTIFLVAVVSTALFCLDKPLSESIERSLYKAKVFLGLIINR